MMKRDWKMKNELKSTSTMKPRQYVWMMARSKKEKPKDSSSRFLPVIRFSFTLFLIILVLFG